MTWLANLVHAEHLSSHLLFTAKMNGDQEVPAVTSDGQGLGIFTLDEQKSTLYINVSLNNLSGAITGIHIHEGLVGVNGGVVYNLGPFLNGNRVKGALRGLTPDVISKMLSGSYYINVHTELNPGGEIRGQIGLETDYRYTAFMNGTAEVPEVVSDGRGLGVFHLNQSRTSVSFKILFTGLSSDVTGAHIHNAPAGMNGGVILDLSPFMTGNRIEGTWEPGPELDALLAGELYVNVHTINNPGGEIRGQITLQPGVTFDANLTGDQENPPVVSPGSGLGVITIWPDLSEVEYYIVYDGLSGDVTGAHFHRAVAGMNGGVVINLTGSIDNNLNIIGGTEPLTLDIFNTLLNGNFYINLHTEANPDGEVRGQVYRFAREGYTFDMNGGQEVPPVTTTGVGAGFVSIDRDQTNAHYMLVVSALEGTFTASHFHNALPGVNGPVIYDITSSFNAFGGAEGYWDQNSTPAFDATPLFRANAVYANVHSSTSPGGEIRGNIVRSSELFGDLPFDPGFSDDLMLTTVLSGEDEEPPVTTDAVALATVFFDADRNTARVNITATGLSGPITGVHIHEGDPGANGPVMFPLTNVGNRVQMEINNIDELQLISLMNSGTYVNIHTEANPGGEIRGQLALDQDIAFISSLSGDQEEPVVVSDGLGLAVIHYTIGQLSIEVNAQLTGLSSEITGAHLHSGMPGENGPVIVDLTDLIDGNTISGKVDVEIEDLLNLFLGNAYINVHTTDHPGGEIRGQTTYLPGITFDGWMSGMQENPFTNSVGSGLAVATIFPGLSDIALWMVADGMSGPIGSAHLHHAPLLTNGSVVKDLSASLMNNSILHLGVIADGVLSALLKGEIYINAHTAAYPGGEIRGQLFRRARDSYGFDLCAEQEVGTVVAPGSSGSGWVSFDRNHSNINLSVVTDGLTGDIAASHIHSAPIGVNGSPIIDLSALFTDGSMFVYGAETDTALINMVRSGNTYINVHTATHPSGEIRGQIVKDFLCSIEVGVDPLADIISDVQLSPVPVVDFLRVAVESQISGRLSFSIADISGKLISTEKFDVAIGENEVTLNTQMLLPGFYVMMISDGKAVQAYKFVK
jgi:Cu/Zn superoxide dismutase